MWEWESESELWDMHDKAFKFAIFSGQKMTAVASRKGRGLM
jgi:hypothetical protein